MSAASTGVRSVIRTPANDQEWQANLRGRRAVFVGEDILEALDDSDVLSDAYDDAPESRHFVAVSDGAVVGGLRTTDWTSRGLPCDHFFDFGPFVAVPRERLATGSHLWVGPTARHTLIGRRLILRSMEAGVARGIEQLVAAVHPRAEPLFRSVGWRSVAPVFEHPTEHCPVLPMEMLIPPGWSAATRRGRRQLTRDRHR